MRDFEKLRQHLRIEKWQVFGGSWGSTLGLAYAMEHPQVVTELVLRGVFLAREKELDWLYEGKGANFIYPAEWKQYEAAIPEEERGNFIAAYGRRLRGELGEEGRSIGRILSSLVVSLSDECAAVSCFEQLSLCTLFGRYRALFDRAHLVKSITKRFHSHFLKIRLALSQLPTRLPKRGPSGRVASAHSYPGPKPRKLRAVSKNGAWP